MGEERPNGLGLGVRQDALACLKKGNVSGFFQLLVAQAAAGSGPDLDLMAWGAALHGYPKLALSLIPGRGHPRVQGWILLAQGERGAASAMFAQDDSGQLLERLDAQLGLARAQGDAKVASEVAIEAEKSGARWLRMRALITATNLGDAASQSTLETSLAGGYLPENALLRGRAAAALHRANGETRWLGEARQHLTAAGDTVGLLALASSLDVSENELAPTRAMLATLDNYLAISPGLGPATVQLEASMRHQMAHLIATRIKTRPSRLSTEGATEGRFTFARVVAESDLMKEARKRAQVAAASDSTILVTGESGTGKEVFAQAIHAASPRAMEPFVGINCAALPASLIESELFGYEPGAFTGADPKGRTGKFEQAGAGTLLLDEIGDMPLLMQVKLLRVLQERRFFRIGANTPTEVRCRIIATTNQNLMTAVKEGNFRGDLFFRLQVFHVVLPRLAERPRDIEKLARQFAERAGAELHNDYLRALLGHSWPGNVRELQHLIERDALLKQGRLVGQPDFAKEDHSMMSAAPSLSLEENEKDLLVAALRKHRGRIPHVAASLGVSRGTVYNKMRKFGIAPAAYRG